MSKALPKRECNSYPGENQDIATKEAAIFQFNHHLLHSYPKFRCSVSTRLDMRIAAITINTLLTYPVKNVITISKINFCTILLVMFHLGGMKITIQSFVI